MPGGNANSKAHSVKPNQNANDSLDLAADPATNPDELRRYSPCMLSFMSPQS